MNTAQMAAWSLDDKDTSAQHAWFHLQLLKPLKNQKHTFATRLSTTAAANHSQQQLDLADKQAQAAIVSSS